MTRLPKLIPALPTVMSLVQAGCTGPPSIEPQSLKTQAIQRLRHSVRSPEPLVKMRAIESCVALGLPNAQDICIKAVSSPAPPLQFVGAMGLIELPTPAARTALNKLLSSSDDSVRLAAIGALRRLGRTEHSALSSPSPKTRSDALMILGRLGDTSAIPAIRPLVEKDPVQRVRLQAGEALVLLGDKKVLPRLQRWQYSALWQDRTFAVQLMGQVKDRQFVPDLLQALSDPNQLVQLQSARSLCRLGQQDGFELALRYLNPNANDEKAIAEKMALGPRDPQLAQRIVQIRSLAALALGEIGKWRAAGPLSKAVDDKDPQVALAAARASLQLLQKTNKAQIRATRP